MGVRTSKYSVTITSLGVFIRWGGWLVLLLITIYRLVLIMYIPVSAVSQPDSALTAQALVPGDGTDADVMEVVYPARLVKLLLQIHKTAQKDPEWFLSHIKKATPGKPLPYDPRLGMTKEEYEELLKLSDEKTLKKGKTVKLRVKQDGDRFAFDGGTELPDLKGVELDVKANVVTTPFGDAMVHTTIKASDDQKTGGVLSPLNGWIT